MRKLFLPLLLLFCYFNTSAQRYSNLRVKQVSLKSDTVLLDSVSIVPNSFFVMDNQDRIVDTSAYSLNALNGVLIWKKKSPQFLQLHQDALKITYRVFPFLFGQTFQHKDYGRVIKSSSGVYNPFYYTPSEGNAELFKFEGLTKSGSISRGVTFGNNQDVFVNSSLNLQLAGKISDNVEILAAITDENVPVQPEGNTQQLQDFDKVFIQLSNENNKLIAGDFDLKRPESYFMNFQKKAQGGLFSTRFNLGKSEDEKKQSVMRITVSGAVSKGKFARDILAVAEGNQGPYPLTGSNNETYIIILAGSEKVYIDGQLLARGAQNDYTIDYNTSQLTFTARRIITKDSRVVVEFEYSEKSYARSLFYFNDEFEKDKLKIKFNVYSEQDSKNQPLQIQLDSSKIALMDSVGDHIDQAFYPTADTVPFNNTQILYQKKDTTTANGTYSGIFVYSVSPDSARWSVSFSIVGQGNGDYIQDINAANGRVYKWVEPVNGVHLGSFAPVALLITPKRQQLFTLGTDYKFSKNNSVKTEIAMSNNDINLFSSKDKSNDVGYAAKVIYENTTQLGKDAVKSWRMKSILNYEYVSQDFKPLERFRAVEFERDWNTTAVTAISDENISSFQTIFSKAAFGSFTYQLKSYLKGSFYNGLMNAAGMNLLMDKFNLTGAGSYLNTYGSVGSTKYYKHNFDLSRPVWKLVVGGRENAEHNEFLQPATDSLFINSFYFQEYQGYAATLDSSKTKIALNYKKRYDYVPVVSQFKMATIADEVNLTVELLKNINSQLRTTSTYRKLAIRDTTLTQQQAEKTFLNRIDYNLNLWKGAVTTSTYYEVGTGQELKKEFSYLLVAAGQGVYAWHDRNHDGVQQLDEFDPAAFPDEALYVKIFIPTNEYISTRTNQFSEVLTLTPSAGRQSFQGKQKLLTRFSNQLSVRLDKKTQNEDLLSSLNPFNQNVGDTELVSNNSNVRNSLFFNRSNPVFGMDGTWQQNKAKSILTSGFESRTQTLREINTRWNFTHSFLFNVSYQNGDKKNSSDFFSTQDFHIVSNESEPKLSYQPTASFRTTVSYKYSLKKNIEGEIGERSLSNKFGVEFRYSTVKAGSFTAKINYIAINFNADENSTIAYDMLEGLHNGRNATWDLSVQRNLSNSMQLSLNYDGRKSEGSNVVHTGGVQFRAFF